MKMYKLAYPYVTSWKMIFFVAKGIWTLFQVKNRKGVVNLVAFL